MDELIIKTEQLLNAVQDNTDILRFDKSIGQHVYAVSLHGTILEMSSAVIALLKEKQYSAIPVVVRNLLEAYVDLVNVIKSPHYLKNMIAAYQYQRNKIFRSALHHGQSNPYLEALANSDDLQQEYDHITKELDDLKRDGFNPLGVKDRFDKTGLHQLYESVYALLCLHSHNNLTILERRHMKKEDNDFLVAYFQLWERDDVLQYVDTIAGILLGSLQQLRKLLEIKSDNKLELAEKALNELRELYT